MPQSSSSSRSSLRKPWLSSTSSTLGAGAAGPVAVMPPPGPWAGTRSGPCRPRAATTPSRSRRPARPARAHAGKAEVVKAALLLLGRRVEADPVVVHLQHHRLGCLGQLDPGAGRPRVPGHVRQRLLGDPVQDDLVVLGQPVGQPCGQGAADPGLLADHLDVVAQGADQAALLQHGRPQGGHDPPQRLDLPGQRGLGVGEQPPALLQLAAPQPELAPLQGQPEPGQPLDGAVVQLGGHAAALPLGHRQDLVDQPARSSWALASTARCRERARSTRQSRTRDRSVAATTTASDPALERPWAALAALLESAAVVRSAAVSRWKPGSIWARSTRLAATRSPEASSWSLVSRAACQSTAAARTRVTAGSPGRRAASSTRAAVSSWRTAAARRAATSSGAPLEVVLESRAACSYARASSRNDSRSARSRRATSPPTRVAPVKDTIAMTTSAAASVHRDGPLARPRRLVPARSRRLHRHPARHLEPRPTRPRIG